MYTRQAPGSELAHSSNTTPQISCYTAKRFDRGVCKHVRSYFDVFSFVHRRVRHRGRVPANGGVHTSQRHESGLTQPPATCPVLFNGTDEDGAVDVASLRASHRSSKARTLARSCAWSFSVSSKPARAHSTKGDVGMHRAQRLLRRLALLQLCVRKFVKVRLPGTRFKKGNVVGPPASTNNGLFAWPPPTLLEACVHRMLLRNTGIENRHALTTPVLSTPIRGIGGTSDALSWGAKDEERRKKRERRAQ